MSDWLLNAAQRFRQRVESSSPPRDPEFDQGAIRESLRLVPSPTPDRNHRDHPCIGCGKPKAKKPRTYCRMCRERVALGIDVEIGDVPTENECRRVLGWERGKRKRNTPYP